MTDYAELARRRKEADDIYRKIRSLELKAYTEFDAQQPAGFKVVVEGLKSLNPDHADRLVRMVQDNEAALAEILPKRGPNCGLSAQTR